MKPTKQMIENEPAGPRLDALFHKYVMEKEVFIPKAWKSWSSLQMTKDEFGKTIPIPKYSSNISHAMAGMEKDINEPSKQFAGLDRFRVSVNNYIWECRYYNGKTMISATAETAPLAITRALLLWAIEKDK